VLKSVFLIFSVKSQLPSATIIVDGNGRYITIDGVNIRINENDDYP